MKKLKLANSELVAIIDDEDAEKTSPSSWRITNRGYIRSNIYIRGMNKLNKKNNWVSLHRLVMDVTDRSVCIDHINGNKLDNRKSNLRICTHSQNSQNTPPRSIVGFKGVSRTKQGTYRARITLNGKGKWLGVFDTAKEAALAFDKEALEHHGEFARLNFPNEAA